MSADALVLTAPHHLERRRLLLPSIGLADGLLRVEACGLCGTDHEQYTGHVPFHHAVVPGHEVVGVIEQAGADALGRWGVEIGQRVAVEVFQSCRDCAACRDGDYRHCTRHGTATMVGFDDADEWPHLRGGYATHLHLGPDAMLLPVPGGIDPVVATLFNPLGAGIRWGVEVPGTSPGDVVAVLGPGVRGLCAAAAAKDAGAGFVMVTGHGPCDRQRLDLAGRFGADLAVDVATTDPVAALVAAAGRRADVVVDVTAKAPAVLAQAVDLARPGGTIVLAGIRGEPGAPDFDCDRVVYKELRLIGALGVDVSAYEAALRLLASGRYPFADLPRQVVGFDELEGLLRVMAGEDEGVPPVHGVFAPT
ncbi:MAG: zinc-binding dehydrogenase [Actinomycetota bacterium]|nr:zinc-binding dehydrogenase [Actinomycetota bacterium]